MTELSSTVYEKATNKPGVYFSGDTAGYDVEYLHAEQHHELVHGGLHLLLDRSVGTNQHYSTGICSKEILSVHAQIRPGIGVEGSSAEF